MLVVETIAKIRRMHFGQGMGIKTICRELNLSKKVVRKVVRSGATEFSYKRTVQPRPKLGAWLAELDRLLATNAARASRERLTVMQLYEELRGLGYDGGYDAVRRYAATWKQAQHPGTPSRSSAAALAGEYPKLCVSDRAHAVFRYGQALKRPANIMAS